MEALSLLQEPIQQTPLKPKILQLLELALMVQPGIMSELSTFYQLKDDSVLEPG